LPIASSSSHRTTVPITMLLLLGATACRFGPGALGVDGSVTPTVLSVMPGNGATGISGDGTVRVTFSEAMDPATLTTASFTLTSGRTSAPILGLVTYADSTAVFSPASALPGDAIFTAALTTTINSSFGVPLALTPAWSFMTGTTGIPVSLGTAGNYVILTKAGITTVPTSVVTGDLGCSPAAGSYVTGFSLVADATNQFSTSTQVIGRVYAADDASPTPTVLTTAIGDMDLAFATAAARTPDVIELGAGNIGGMTLAPRVYRWSSGLSIPLDLELVGNATDVWIFQVAGDVDLTADRKVVLRGGARAKNVFWQVAGSVTLGARAELVGIVLAGASVTFGTSAVLNGRLLVKTHVSIAGSTLSSP
jgi:hypothetical protein